MFRTSVYKVFLLLAFFQIIVVSCNDPGRRSGIEQFSWLVGEWRSTGDMNFVETWDKPYDNKMKGNGYFIENEDTLMSEQLLIFASDSGIYYQASVSSQNNNLPVFFKLVEKQADSLVFSNPEHDFPKLIIYRMITFDSIRVHVLENADPGSQGFNLTMIKQQ